MSALDHVRVLELTSSVHGEYCGKLLADFGAEVIKLEAPGVGSPTRHMQPLAADAAAPESSGLFAYLNTNKRSVVLDIDADPGRKALDQLVAKVDVVICDRSAAWLSARGLDPETFLSTYPRLVLCSVTPYGQSETGEIEFAEDLNVFHSSGWGYHTPSGSDNDRPPLKGPGRFMASYESGLDAAMCIAAALFDRDDCQQGQYIDVSMQAVLASRTDYVLGQMIAGDMPVSADRRAFDLAGPAGIFPCQDGFIYIWMSAPGHWDALAEMLGHPEWMKEFPEHWLERACTPDRVEKVRYHITEWLQTQNKHEVAETAQKLGLILVPVNEPRDLQESPQYQFREFFQAVKHPVLGEISYPTVPYRLASTPVAIQSAAPLLGQHSEETLVQLAIDTKGGEA